MRRFLALALLALLAPAAHAQEAPVTTPAPGALYEDGHAGRYLVDGPWEFRKTTAEPWTQVTIPHAWNATDMSDQSMRGSVGWYRKRFRLPSGSPRGAKWLVRFESVNLRANVYLNGRLLARHEGAYLPFEVELSNARRGVNELTVRVDSRRTTTTLPPIRNLPNGRPSGGWWNYSGILREVYLRRVDRVDLENVLARPALKCRTCSGALILRARLVNHTRRRQKVRVAGSVEGLTARFPRVTVPPSGTREVSARVNIPNPRLWEPGNPELYEFGVAAQIRGRTVSRWAGHAGIRSVRVSSDGRVIFNGRPVTLRGASLHEDDPLVGSAMTPELRTELFTTLEDLGATITRAHYPVHPHFMEMADRAGILFWSQVPMYQHSNANLQKYPSITSKGLTFLREMIERDQNHPSVLTWSIGNEMPTRVAGAQQRYIRSARSLAKRMDPTRLVAIDFAGYPSALPSDTYRSLDAVGVNSYFGWYPGPNGQIDDVDLLPGYLDQLHFYYPRLALFITEFGAEANRDGPIDEKGTFAFQRQLVEDHLTVYDSKPFVNGAVIWILRDFRVRPEWDGGNPKPFPPYNQKGITSETGARKPAFHAAARMFRNVEPLAGAGRISRRR